MAGYRGPDVLGETPPTATPRDHPGVLGGGFPSTPVGSAVPLDTPAPAAAAKAATVELNLVGSFPKPGTWTAAKEKQLIGADTWFPHTLDFKAVAGSGSLEVTSVWDFLLKIVQAKSLISRLNFFSHATTGLIAIEGKLLDDGSNVQLATTGTDGKWTQIISGKSGPIMDPYAGTWGTFGENSGSVSVTVGATPITLAAVRAKFAADATIWLYLCHGASDPNLFQQVANTFQVTAKGFTKELLYCAPANFPTSRKHRVAVLTTAKPADSCGSGVLDFHGLDSNSNVRTATPRKPP
jgi:hypothetical protein